MDFNGTRVQIGFFLEAAMKSGPKECQDTSACAWRRARDLGAPNSSQACSQL